MQKYKKANSRGNVDERNIISKKSTFTRWWFWLTILVLAGIIIFMLTATNPNNKNSLISLGLQPKCPANLEGILTYQLIDISKISALTPLGNLNPPGHTSPVDHIYFNTNTTDKIALYAPADSTITDIIEIKRSADSNKPSEYVVQYTVCEGLKLDFAGYTELAGSLKNEFSQKKPKSCSGEAKKEGHTGAEQQCGYNINLKVKSGELLGYTQAQMNEGRFDLPFEIWAANYNIDPPANIDWSFYQDDRYAHIMCPFDLYSGSLKNQFYARLGGMVDKAIKDEKTGKEIKIQTSTFTPRTIEPICGTVNQNIVGTIQGMWFGEGWKDRKDKDNVGNTRQFSFLHNNVDPTLAELGNAGEITNGVAGQIQFTPKQSGTIDREPSQVKVDGQVYCYNYPIYQNDPPTVSKILVQLTDERHLKLEYQSGECSTSESFQKPYNYER